VSPVAWDPLSGEPVLIAPTRALRPHDTARPDLPPACPFCEGAEVETPPETYAVRGAGASDGPGWLARAVPNKYPAVDPAEGVHEVVINTPRHVVAFADLTDEEARRATEVWGMRLRAIGEDPRGLWPFCFLNQGAAAGASLQHSHAQLVGLPFEPPRLLTRERAFDGAEPIARDLERAGPRLVEERDGLAVWCPEVPPLSGAVRIAPVEARPDWDEGTDYAAVGSLLRATMERIGRELGADAINLWLHQRRPSGPEGFHWHLDVVPRLGTLAGLELGTGVIAAAHSSETVAARLRGEHLTDSVR